MAEIKREIERSLRQLRHMKLDLEMIRLIR